jgi:Kef-type K+ transport system membrane component KefB
VRQVFIYSLLLAGGMVIAQFLPLWLGDAHAATAHVVQWCTMAALAFIMIHVGYEFVIDRRNLRKYGWDYVVAMSAAALPWIFVTLYFVFVMLPPSARADGDAWKETLLAGRFAAPTSAGVLFTMLAAAGLGATWLFRKARILAIFDDLDTVLLMIPLKMLMVGWAWQLGVVVVLMFTQLWLAWKFMHRVALPVTWPWVLGYAVAIALACQLVFFFSVQSGDVPVHIEVLLPAFVLGCMLRHPHDARGPHAEVADDPSERRAATAVSAIFMLLVGLSMPAIFAQLAPGASTALADTLTGSQPFPSWTTLVVHVLLVTLLANLGKMLPAFCYRREAHWRERLAVAIALWPRGEVGAGVLIISLSYGLGGPVVTVAMLSLALNLLLTGVFIVAVKRLVSDLYESDPAATRPARSQPLQKSA